MVGRELAGSHRMHLAMPARTVPAMGGDMGLDCPPRQADVRRTGWSGVRRKR
jgi:hypothetical protein